MAGLANDLFRAVIVNFSRSLGAGPERMLAIADKPASWGDKVVVSGMEAREFSCYRR